MGVVEPHLRASRPTAHGQDGRFDSASYQAFVQRVMAETCQPMFLIQDGAKYHTSKSTREFFEQHRDRITVCQLPSYSPDYNPIEYLWRKTKKHATHNKYIVFQNQILTSIARSG